VLFGEWRQSRVKLTLSSGFHAAQESTFQTTPDSLSMSVLPRELYRMIVEKVDHEDLRDLTTVSRLFQVEAERLT
jgi:hypothetical protein